MSGGGVAVIIAAWEAQASIGHAVRSALAQDGVDEVIVVDDASADDTARLAGAQDDGSGRLSIIRQARNGGPAAARNVALGHSRAPYFCVLDSDDYFLPGRIARLLAGGGADWDMLADDIVIVPKRLEHVDISLARTSPDAACAPIDLAAFVTGNISEAGRPRGEMGFLKPIIRRDFLRRHGLAYDEAMRLGEDYALYTRALMAGARFRLAGACGYVAVERHNSISSQHSAWDLEGIARFDQRCLGDHPGLSLAARAAFAAHHASMLHKCRYRAILDCKRERGLLPALAMLVSVPGSLPYIASETFRAKTRALRDRRRRPPALRSEGRIRLLLGVPGVRLSYAGAAEPQGMTASARSPTPVTVKGR